MVPGAKKTVGEALKAAYIAGYADGLATGQTVGYAAGHALGIFEGASSLAIVFGLISFGVLTVVSRFVRVERK